MQPILEWGSAMEQRSDRSNATTRRREAARADRTQASEAGAVEPDVLRQLAASIANRWRTEYAAALANRVQVMRDWSTERPIGRHCELLLDDSFDPTPIARAVLGIDLPKTSKPPKAVLVMMRDGGGGVGAGGVWASELTATVATLVRAGYDVQVGTVRGNPPTILNASTGTSYQDPAFGAPVVSEGEIAIARAFLDPDHEFGRLMRPENIVDLSEYIPEAPLYSDMANDPSALDRYEVRVAEGVKALASRFDGVVWPGGSGGTLNQADDRSQTFALAMSAAGKPQAGICNGALLFSQTIDPATNRALIFGHHVTTHSRGDDPRVGERGNLQDSAARKQVPTSSWGFLTDSGGVDPFGPQNYAGVDNPIVLASVSLANAAGSPELFHSELGTPNSVVADQDFITARTTTDGVMLALALRAKLEGFLDNRAVWIKSHDEQAVELAPGAWAQVRSNSSQ